MLEFISTMAIIIIVPVFILIVLGVRIVPEGSAFVLERLGSYADTWDSGVHVMIPFIDRISKKVIMKEQVADFAPQPVITKDNVTIQLDSVIYFKIQDARAYAYGVESPIIAMENLTATTLRNIIGDMTLDETLTSREVINSKMLSIIDSATDPWGIKVTRVELKNIIPPEAIRIAMEKQMKAEREKRAAILTAEGQKQSMILEAEGKKESALLEAEAKKQATILAAEAERRKTVEEAEGQAEAIEKIQKATAHGLMMLKQADVNDEVLKLKGIEAFAKAADGKATKIIIPSDLQGLTGLITALKDGTGGV